jgi:glycosyltransferase involved in cell wall biosynthesis
MLDVWALNQGRFKKRIYSALIERQTLRRAALIHAVRENEAEDVRRFGITTEVVTIPNGVNPVEFDQLPERETFIKKHQFLMGKTIFLFLGRLHPKKGVALLAKAFSEIARSRSDVALIIAGPDEVGFRKEMEKCLNAEGAAGRYVFTGLLSTEERREVLAAADVFVLPSFSEGFPIAPLEALASGLPVILTEACNIPGIEANGAGLIIKAETPALRDAMLKLASNEALRNEMGRKGRNLVLAKYTWDEIAARLTEVYRAVLDGPRSSVGLTS